MSLNTMCTQKILIRSIMLLLVSAVSVRIANFYELWLRKLASFN